LSPSQLTALNNNISTLQTTVNSRSVQLDMRESHTIKQLQALINKAAGVQGGRAAVTAAIQAVIDALSVVKSFFAAASDTDIVFRA
jgi:hypothetical protein